MNHVKAAVGLGKFVPWLAAGIAKGESPVANALWKGTKALGSGIWSGLGKIPRPSAAKTYQGAKGFGGGLWHWLSDNKRLGVPSKSLLGFGTTGSMFNSSTPKPVTTGYSYPNFKQSSVVLDGHAARKRLKEQLSSMRG